MRTYEMELGGQPVVLAANFKASLEIASKIGDPLTIMREAALEAMFIQRGINYEPKWRFTVENVPLLLFIGLKAAGSPLRLEDVQNGVFDMGFTAARDHAGEYLSLIVGPRPEETLEDTGEDNSGNAAGPTS